MRKISALLLLCCGWLHAQNDTIAPGKLASRRNEVRTDLLSLATMSKANISYERFMGDWSVGASFGYADSKKLNEDFDQGDRENIPHYEVIPYVRYKMSKSSAHYYFAELFAAANGGDFRETKRLVENNVGYYSIEKTKYFDVALGGGLGYKMYVRERLAIELLVAFGYNLTNRDQSPDVLSRVGLSVGYRF